MANIYSVHYDENVWPDPNHFRPERHLDSEGKLIQSDNYLPFGLGAIFNFQIIYDIK